MNRVQDQNQPTEPWAVDPREEEIKELKTKLRSYEKSTIRNHDNNGNNIQPSKNEKMAQRETGQSITEISEMKNYLAGVMSAISAFDTKLSNQLGQSQTHTDRL